MDPNAKLSLSISCYSSAIANNPALEFSDKSVCSCNGLCAIYKRKESFRKQSESERRKTSQEQRNVSYYQEREIAFVIYLPHLLTASLLQLFSQLLFLKKSVSAPLSHSHSLTHSLSSPRLGVTSLHRESQTAPGKNNDMMAVSRMPYLLGRGG